MVLKEWHWKSRVFTLSDIQRRHFYDGLVHLERDLAAIESILAAAESPGLFPRYANDLTPAMRTRIEQGLAHARAGIRGALAAIGQQPEAPSLGAAAAIRSHLRLTELGTEELGARGLRAYGELPGPEGERLDHLAAELRDLVAAILPPAGDAAAARVVDRAALADALEAAAGRACDTMAEALANALEAGRPNDEFPLIAGDVLASVAREVCLERGLQPPLPPIDIDRIRWRLDRPKLALGRNYRVATFRKQIEPLRAEIRAALRTYGLTGFSSYRTN